MKLAELGERKLVELLRRKFGKGREVEVGIGDDAAVLRIGGELMVLTTDILFQSTHFPPQTTPEQMGWKALVVTISDLAAMGAEPIAVTFSVGLPPTTEVRELEKIADGMKRAAKKYGVSVVGGDLNEDEEVVISGSAVGKAERVLRRCGARPGDLLAVTNRLGRASAGLYLLTRSLPVGRYRELLKALLEPEARVKEGKILTSGGATSAIDLSDGLALNLWQLAVESGVRMVLERVPTHPLVERFSAEHGLDPLEFSQFGGEDYELLFTFPSDSREKLEKELRKVGSSLTVIGRVEKGRGVVWEREGKLVPLPEQGYEHFR